jgi:GNAT superfamily N-acetyltransferase
MQDSIQIIEKPDWVTWDEIHNILWKAHAENRENGIVMRYASLSGEEIRQRIEDRGKLFCAIVNNKVVGTGALVVRHYFLWFTKGYEPFGYMCFASVLPEYTGKGIYKYLILKREQFCREKGINRMMFDTHERNIHTRKILEKNNFKPVNYSFYKDHYNLVMVKWLDGCPYSDYRLKFEFTKIKIKAKVKRLLKLFVKHN